MGYLGIGIYNCPDYATSKNLAPVEYWKICLLKKPEEFWKICLPTSHCRRGKKVYTYWQNEERKKERG